MKLSCLVKPEVDYYLQELNLTEEETEVFKLLTQGKTAIYIADRMCMAERTVYRIKLRIEEKMKRV